MVLRLYVVSSKNTIGMYTETYYFNISEIWNVTHDHSILDQHLHNFLSNSYTCTSDHCYFSGPSFHWYHHTEFKRLLSFLFVEDIWILAITEWAVSYGKFLLCFVRYLRWIKSRINHYCDKFRGYPNTIELLKLISISTIIISRTME